MASDILQYADLVLKENWSNHRPQMSKDTNRCHCIRGAFREEDAGMFFSLHPNKSVIEKPIACMHTHDYIELVYVRRGTLHQSAANQRMSLGEGSIFLMNDGTAHQPWVTGTDDIVVNLGMRKDKMKSILSSVTEKKGNNISPFTNALFDQRTGKRNQYLHIHNNPTITSLLNEMFCEYFKQDEYAEQVLLIDLVRLVIELCRHKSSAPLEASLPDPDDTENVVYSIQKYLEKNYATVSMEELSRHFNYSQRHMRRILRNISEDGLPGMLNQLKIRKACEYIDKYRMPTNEIMQLVGFNDAGYFYRVFKSTVGMSVTDYRQC